MAVAVAASGCSQILGSQSPEQQFKSQISDMTSSEYHVTYDIEMNVGGMGGIISNAVQEPELYSDGENSKFVADVTGMTFAIYNLYGNRTTSCTEGSVFGLTNSSGIDCSVSTGTSTTDFEEAFEKVNITRNGTRTAAERECNMYVLRGAENVNSSAVPDQAEQYDDGTFNVCLDKQKGYPAIVSVKSDQQQSSELRDSSGTREVVRVETTSYDADLSGVSLEVPVDISTSVTCEPFQANITTFDYSGETQVSVNGENRTVQLESESTETLNFSNESRISGTNEVIVDTGNERTESTCYHYESLFGDTDYDFDYNYSQ